VVQLLAKTLHVDNHPQKWELRVLKVDYVWV
jgi:hypothetical protein